MRFFINILFFITFISYSQDSLNNLLERSTKHSIPFISVEQLKAHQQNFLLLDARKWEEFHISHLQNALWVGYKKFSAEEILQQIKNKETPIVVYCSLGIRSEKIGEQLKKLGYNNIQNLYGGIFEWKNKGYPVFNNQEQIIEKVHAFNKRWGKWLHNAEKVYE